MTKKQKRELKQILIAGVIFAALMILEHSGVLPDVFRNHWVMMIPYLVPYLICGRDVVQGCIHGIRNRQMFDEKLLMTIATFGAFVTGENSEAVAVMLFYQVGEWFQRYAVGKSRRSIADLMDIAPETAEIEREDGTIEEIDPDEVEVGDVLVIRAGEKIPVDGIVLEGESMLNTAALTGESVPRKAAAGDKVISGCINGEGLLRIRAEKKYEDSTVAKILEMVEEASSRKSRTENFITRFARYYTPIVVFGAIALALIPPIFVGGFSDWILRACTFLVISCPCALVISVPLAFFGGIGAASNIGVLVKGSNYLEQMAELHTVVSDKTGTLTRGEFKVQKILPAPGVSADNLLEQAAAAESLSTHPIALSILEAYGREVPPHRLRSVENVSGKGLIALLDEEPGAASEEAPVRFLIGNARLMREQGISFPEIIEPAATILYAAAEDRYLGAILIADSPKPEVPEAIRGMLANGVRRIIMLTGDRREAAEAVAKELGITEVCAELLPGDKVARVEQFLGELKDDKHARLGFIGDGINDAPVLSRADVGIAMGSLGSDAAIEAADIVIMDDDLRKIPETMRIARRTVGISRQNIVFALFVKILCLILGALGIANMWAAVFADVGVAVLCILNSMRMLIRRKTS